MEMQFRYLIDLATLYDAYVKNPGQLYQAINNLPQNQLDDILQEYGDPDRKIQPVNVLRAEVARLRLAGTEVTPDLVEQIKREVRTKNAGYFTHLNAAQLQQLADYPVANRDMFANWQRPWNIFHTYFYRNGVVNTKETVQTYLKQIAQDLIQRLDLKEYHSHTVDFQGASNFGSSWSWLALFPLSKDSHKQAYQFFMRFSAQPETGCMAGWELKNERDNEVRPIQSYEEAVQVLGSLREKVMKLNGATRSYFKFAPGSQASEWEQFQKAGEAAISYRELKVGDLSQYQSLEELNVAGGLPADSQSNQTWNLWLFRKAAIGDVLFASKGSNTVVGIGIVEGEYYHAPEAGNYMHRRKVNWITDKVYEYKPNSNQGYPRLFRTDSFSPTKVWNFILSEYARLYPDLIPVFEANGLSYQAVNASSYNTDDDDANQELNEPDGTELEGGANYWWLNANPDIWSISKTTVGEKQFYTSKNEKGNKRRVYKHFEAVRPGDIVIGYESSPVRQIKAIFEITDALHQNEKLGEVIGFQVTEKLEVPVHWNELQNLTGLQDAEVFINNQGSLFRLSPEEFEIIRDVIDTKNIVQEQQLEKGDAKAYSFKDDPDKPFLSEKNFLHYVSLLERKKNIILQGPPGVGKTFIAKKLAFQLMGHESEAQIETVQFHQSYSYEDFIQGLRPKRSGGFELKNGAFYTFCQRAIAHPERKFFFIIDEINRGNLSKIFGELLMLIEADKRGEKNRIRLAYAEDEKDLFYVPENLYIIGTMNTADRSLAIIDYALRRRFAFIPLEPDFDASFQSFLRSKGMSASLVVHICEQVAQLNEKIKRDVNLGSGFQVGHSYFCSFQQNSDEGRWWQEVLDYEVRPLLEEIWFDDLTKAEEAVTKLSR